jgi:3-hydroxyacyl-[acyl-carrier-protein] dehydratase
LVSEYNQFRENVVLAKIPKVRFHCQATPGDTLVYTTTVDYIRRDGAMVTAESHIGDRLQAEMEIVFAHLDGGLGEKTLYGPEHLIQMLRVLRVFEVGRAADGSPLPEPAWAGGQGGPQQSDTT